MEARLAPPAKARASAARRCCCWAPANAQGVGGHQALNTALLRMRMRGWPWSSSSARTSQARPFTASSPQSPGCWGGCTKAAVCGEQALPWLRARALARRLHLGGRAARPSPGVVAVEHTQRLRPKCRALAAACGGAAVPIEVVLGDGELRGRCGCKVHANRAGSSTAPATNSAAAARAVQALEPGVQQRK